MTITILQKYRNFPNSNLLLPILIRKISTNLVSTKKTDDTTISPFSNLQFKSDEEFNAFWNSILRAEEECFQRKYRQPWIQLDLIKIFTRGNDRHSMPSEFVFGCRKKLDERRALINPEVRLLHYPFEASTQPLGIDPALWKEAFKKSRLFLIGTKHDSLKSLLDVNLLMGAVYADFIMLGLNRSLAELIIFSKDEELEKPALGLPIVSKQAIEELVQQRLKDEGMNIDNRNYKINSRIEKLKYLAQFRKYLTLQSEFRSVRNMLISTMPTCAGYVLGLEKDEKLCRLVDLGEEFLMEDILLIANAEQKNRVPRFGMDLQSHGMYWTQKLVNWIEYQNSLGFRFSQFPTSPSYLQEVQGKQISSEFDEFMEKEFPGFLTAMIARQDRQMVRVLHTLFHQKTIEKLRAAHRQNCIAFEPLTVIGIVGHRNLNGICDIWNRPEEIYTNFTT